VTRLREFLKRDVVALAEGLRLGRPDEILIDPATHGIEVIVLQRGAVAETSLICRRDAIQSFGEAVLPLRGLADLAIAHHDPDALDLMSQGIKLKGRPMLDSHGRQLGRIVAVEVDSQGAVVEYRIRRGLLGWLRPPEAIPAALLHTLGQDVAVAEASENAEPGPPP
jgi:uncharacterized protein YrrD